MALADKVLRPKDDSKLASLLVRPMRPPRSPQRKSWSAAQLRKMRNQRKAARRNGETRVWFK